MIVDEICQPDVVVIGPFENLTAVAQLMRDKHVGCAVVVEPGSEMSKFRPVGVITDRDIVTAVVAREADSRSLRVDDVMTREPLMALTKDTVAETLHEMRRMGVRRVPVVNDQGDLVGLLSLDNVIDALAMEKQDVAVAIRSEPLIDRPTQS